MEPIGPDVHAAADEFARQYLARLEINAIGVGYRTVRGARTPEQCVRVLVTRKRPRAYLPAARVLPSRVSVRGARVAVDVEQGGPFYSLAVLSLADEVEPVRSTRLTGVEMPVYTDRYRPALSGVSLGHKDITAGTLGCVVTDDTDGSLQVLSNNHVLADTNAGETGDEILQPGPADGGRVAEDVLAHLKRYVPISWTDTNTVDCAIAAPISPDQVASASVSENVDPVGKDHPAVGLVFAGDCSGLMLACPASAVGSRLQVTFPGGASDASAGMVVEKVGRTTGWTVGQVEDSSVQAKVNYGPVGVATFSGLFTVPSFSHPGDSGSLVMRGVLG